MGPEIFLRYIQSLNSHPIIEQLNVTVYIMDIYHNLRREPIHFTTLHIGIVTPCSCRIHGFFINAITYERESV